ncbi:hypothetical protein TRICI_001907 [Trichomonascus ciferrii]|uniref:BZIP domain-containing protein n=1 Tax=Trichomonascus ciferrii TaxID=44093 RepID=A0A642V803_9ASCO|nr:hypothetical protein TRICI_001907 [Trichomonascus ciferrii]
MSLRMCETGRGYKSEEAPINLEGFWEFEQWLATVPNNDNSAFLSAGVTTPELGAEGEHHQAESDLGSQPSSSHQEDSKAPEPQPEEEEKQEQLPEQVREVRKRIEKRKRRAQPDIVTPPSEEGSDAKRAKNTIAARKYRQKRQQEVEVLDKRVKELEEQLTMAKVETKWWKMEAERWKSLAEDKK